LPNFPLSKPTATSAAAGAKKTMIRRPAGVSAQGRSKKNRPDFSGRMSLLTALRRLLDDESQRCRMTQSAAGAGNG